MTAVQYALPCCAQAPSKGCEWIADRYPVTAEELATVPEGVRLARFMNREDCAGCSFGPFDHTVGWKYQTAVCLRVLAKLGLWKPEDEEWYRLWKEDER